jgi:hypothetical protein
MANNFDSNVTRKLARVFLEKFESARVMSKNVDTQLLKGQFGPSTGDTVDFKRPTDYTSYRNATGDLTSATADSIITGKASGVVQDYFTVYVNYNEADQAIKMDQLDQLLAPMATRICTDLELDFSAFMMKNTGLVAGTVGTSASTWAHIAEAGAVLQADGIPMDAPWTYAVNPFTQRALSGQDRGLGAGGAAGSVIKTANAKATIAENYAGFDKVLTATTLPSYTTWSGADRAGTLTGAPTVTYLGAKDTMTQVLAVTAFTANQQVRAGETITIAGRYRLNQSTREVILDESGNKFTWSGTVTEAVTLGASGEGNITVTGPAIYEAAGAHNTVDSSPTTSDVVTLLGALSTTIQPNLFWHRQAFSIGSVPIEKLYSTDTLATTKDGLQMRVSKFSDGVTNVQKVRFDLRPAYAVLNPFFAGQGFGSA